MMHHSELLKAKIFIWPRDNGTIKYRKTPGRYCFQVSKLFIDAIHAILIKDLEANVVDLNRAAGEVCSLGMAELLGGPLATMVSPDRMSGTKEFHERYERGEKVERVETAPATKSEPIDLVMFSPLPIRNELGEPPSTETTIKCQGNLKRTHQELRAQVESLERSNKNLEEFAYVAAHDLREPLLSIAGYIKLLERHMGKMLDAQAHKFIDHAFDTITRMDGLIQSILSCSREDSEARDLNPTDCNSVLAKALSNLKSSLQASGAKVIYEPLPTVIANPSQLVQVFQNLVSNAIRFAGDEPLRIHIGAQREENVWKFFVKDNGMGIEPPYFDRIFRIFQRINSDPERSGTGIGLANCKKIIERHGGRIWVESKPGKGATFFFTMPVGVNRVSKPRMGFSRNGNHQQLRVGAP